MSGAAFGAAGTPVPSDPVGPCPCGTGRPFLACCGPLLDRTRQAGTAEELMRSRYTAFAVGDVHHLARTWHPRTLPPDLGLDPGLAWVRLEVLDTSGGGPSDEAGTVHFRGHWTGPDGPGVLEEISLFGRRGRHRRWVYDRAL